MHTRRRFIVCAAASTACAPRDEHGLKPIWLRVTPGDSHYVMLVEGDVVRLPELEQALLDHALAANPGLSPEEARQTVHIYVRADPGVPTNWVDDLMPVLCLFEKVALVAEDRRD